MRFSWFRRVVGGLLLAAAAAPAWAQQPAAHNPAVDTIRPANAQRYEPVSHLVTVSGQHLYVFVSSFSELGTGLIFTYQDPQTQPRPRPVFAASRQIRYVRTGSEYVEPVRLAGKKPGALVPRVAAGPRVELFDYATFRPGFLFPTPGVIFTPIPWTGTLDKDFRHALYLRRPGDSLMVKLPSGKKALPFLAHYFADVPELADAIRARAGTKDYRYADVPALVARYNASLPPGAAPPLLAFGAATDTTQPADPRQYQPVARLGLHDGRVLPIFIIDLDLNGKGILVANRHPRRPGHPSYTFVPSDQLAWLSVDGRYYETMLRAGHPYSGPVLRRLTGPRAELFDIPSCRNWRRQERVIKRRNTPGSAMHEYFYWGPPFSDNFDHAYLVRRPGEKLMMDVPAGAAFATFMADYLADAPALAARVRTGAVGYDYANLPAILREYNTL